MQFLILLWDFVLLHDVLILYTDGLIDLNDEDRNIFGEKRFIDNLKSLKGNAPVEIIDKLEKSLYIFKGSAKQKDDLSIVAVKFKPD